MAWQVTSVDSITGEVVGRLDVSEFTWERKLSAGAGHVCKIPLDGSGYSRTDMRDLTEHWARTIVLEHDSGVVAAGIVRRRQVIGREITLHLTDLWGLWEKRLAVDHTAPEAKLWSTTYTNLSLGTIAKRTVQWASTNVAQPDITLPLTLPADVSGTITRTYYGHRWEWVGSVLDDLMVEGLDIDFRPRWVSGVFDWEMVTDPAVNTWEWHVNAPNSGVAGFREDSDGSRMVNNSVVVGEGSGTAMVARSLRSLTSPLPLMERVEARKAVSDPDQAFALASQLLTQYEHPTVSYSFDVLASGNPAVGQMRLGDTVHLWFDGDPWWTDGKHERRIVKLNGGLGEKVTVTCQETGGS